MQKLIVFFLFWFSLSVSLAQTGSRNHGIFDTGLSFLRNNTNPQSAGFAEIGVVAPSTYYESGLHGNPALLSRNRKISGIYGSYTPWLRGLNTLSTNLESSGIDYVDFGAYLSLGKRHTIAYRGMHFNWGETRLLIGVPFSFQGSGKPKGMSHSLRYGRSLSKSLSIGMGLSYLYSNFKIQGIFTLPTIERAAHSVAADIGLHHTKKFKIKESSQVALNTGFSVTNVGPKISYSKDNAEKKFLPTQLQLGVLIEILTQPIDEIRFGMDAAYQVTKLLVPTEGNMSTRSATGGIFSSFSDAPGGFSEEMQEVIHQRALEAKMQYKSNYLIALRVGSFTEHINKGGRKYATIGTGFGLYGIRLDVAYLIPYSQNHPLQKTIRMGLSYQVDLDKKGFRMTDW